MEERKMEDLMIDYVEGNLKGELRDHVQRTIEKSPEWKLEFERVSKVVEGLAAIPDHEPDESIHTDFESLLNEEIRKELQGARRLAPHISQESSQNQWFLRIAASIGLIAFGALLAVIVMNNRENARELAALKSEMELTRNIVMVSLGNQTSASNRLDGVNTAMSMEVSDKQIIEALVKTMNTDDNTNVRLAAVSALARFSDDLKVRSELLKALETQENPLVLINLINLMVKLKEKKAIEPLKVIMDKTEVLDAVKEEAQMGLFKLS